MSSGSLEWVEDEDTPPEIPRVDPEARERPAHGVRGVRGEWLRDLGLLAVRNYALCAVFVLAVAAVNLFAGLGSVAVNDSDEARYGVSAWEMLQNRSFIVTTYAGEREYWNLKPPLGYWPMALSFWLLGPSPFALRLPSALFALGVVAGTLWLGRRWLGRRESLIAALIVATAFGFLSNHGARSGDLDAGLTLLLLFAAFEVTQVGRSPWRLVSLAAILSAGFLLKSFAILPTLVFTGIYWLWTGDWRRLRAVPALVATAVFAAPIALWALARVQADGSAYFLRRMIREDLLERSTQVIDKVTYSPLGYVAALFDRFAPWPLVLLIALGAGITAGITAWRAPGRRRYLPPLSSPARWTAERRAALVLLALWALVPLALFSLSRTQHHWYLDPTYPAWAMLVALAILDFVRRVRPARRPAAILACLLIPLALCEVRVLYRVLYAERMPESQQFLARLGAHREELGDELHTSPLRHSERFILQVMDGFNLHEQLEQPAGRPATVPAPPAPPVDDARPSVLIAKAAPGRRPKPALGSGLFLANPHYLVFEGNSQVARRSLVRPQHRRIPQRRTPNGHLPPSWRPHPRIAPA